MPQYKLNPWITNLYLGVCLTTLFLAVTSIYNIAPSQAQPQEAPAASAEEVLALGQVVYEGQCRKCHDSGLAGAVKITKKEAWRTKLETKGLETLFDHAINGYEGDDGEMPPRGGKKELTDEEVKAAVQYMLKKSQE